MVVSGGKEYLEMIDVVDMSFDKAAAQLEAKGFIVEEPEYEYSDSVASGNVISSSPVAGDPILPGDSVHLVVSQGVQVKTVRVPSVIGQSLEGARVTLTSHGLTIAGVTEVTNDRPQGQVIYQSVAANTEVEEGTSVTLQVSKGPEQAEEPEVKTETTVVPTITGQSLENARSLLADANLRVASVTEVDSDAPAGQVVYQSLPAGTSVEENTGVSLQVSKGRPRWRPTSRERSPSYDRGRHPQGPQRLLLRPVRGGPDHLPGQGEVPPQKADPPGGGPGGGHRPARRQRLPG